MAPSAAPGLANRRCTAWRNQEQYSWIGFLRMAGREDSKGAAGRHPPGMRRADIPRGIRVPVFGRGDVWLRKRYVRLPRRIPTDTVATTAVGSIYNVAIYESHATCAAHRRFVTRPRHHSTPCAGST